MTRNNHKTIRQQLREKVHYKEIENENNPHRVVLYNDQDDSIGEKNTQTGYEKFDLGNNWNLEILEDDNEKLLRDYIFIFPKRAHDEDIAWTRDTKTLHTELKTHLKKYLNLNRYQYKAHKNSARRLLHFIKSCETQYNKSEQQKKNAIRNRPINKDKIKNQHERLKYNIALVLNNHINQELTKIYPIGRNGQTSYLYSLYEQFIDAFREMYQRNTKTYFDAIKTKNELEKENKDLQSETKVLKEKQAIYENKLNKYEKENDRLNVINEESKYDLEDLKKRNRDLANYSATLTSQKSTLEAENKKLEQDVSNLTNHIAGLHSEIQSLKKQTPQGQINALTKTNQMLQAEIVHLKQALDKFIEIIIGLLEKLPVKQRQVKDLEAQTKKETDPLKLAKKFNKEVAGITNQTYLNQNNQKFFRQGKKEAKYTFNDRRLQEYYNPK